MSTRASVLIADPPWPFRDKLPGPGRGAAKHYGLLTIDDIATFPLPLLADDAVLFLWRVASMVAPAEVVAHLWGFTPKTELVWLKKTVNGKRWFGMGHYVRAEHETCIIATRGRWRPAVRNVRSTFEAQAGRHSTKPDEFYDIVDRLAPGGRRVELFARTERSGFECYGNELEEAHP